MTRVVPENYILAVKNNNKYLQSILFTPWAIMQHAQHTFPNIAHRQSAKNT